MECLSYLLKDTAEKYERSFIRADKVTDDLFTKGSPDQIRSVFASHYANKNLWKHYDPDMHFGRSSGFLLGLLKVLCWKRDNQQFELSYCSFTQFCTLDAVQDMLMDEAIPIEAKKGLNFHATELPGVSVGEYCGADRVTKHYGYYMGRFILDYLLEVSEHILKALSTAESVAPELIDEIDQFYESYGLMLTKSKRKSFNEKYLALKERALVPRKRSNAGASRAVLEGMLKLCVP